MPLRLTLLAAALSLAALALACDDAPPPSTTPAPHTPRATPTPPSARIIDRIDTNRRAIALTFDTGVAAAAADVASVLRALREANVRATFSITGTWGEQQRDLLFSIAADGHRIINGTYDGASFTGASTNTPPLSAADRTLALSRAEVTVYRYTSRSTRPFFRPPFGDVDEGVLRDAAANAYPTIILWTVDVPGTASAAETARAISDTVAPGVIYRLPLTAATAEALPAALAAITSAGFEIRTIEDLVPSPSP